MLVAVQSASDAIGTRNLNLMRRQISRPNLAWKIMAGYLKASSRTLHYTKEIFMRMSTKNLIIRIPCRKQLLWLFIYLAMFTLLIQLGGDGVGEDGLDLACGVIVVGDTCDDLACWVDVLLHKYFLDKSQCRLFCMIS